MRVVVSACLMGRKCKYNGGDNASAAVQAYVQGHEVVAVCPEQLAGLPTPRTCIEQRCGRLVDRDGNDVDAQCRAGVQRAMEIIGEAKVDLAILQPRSPTCGVHQVYDGTFTGRLVEGQGTFAAELIRRGVRVIEPDELA